ncbi:hypothetical protein BGZ65_004014, partial [Modicella reniformis]
MNNDSGKQPSQPFRNPSTLKVTNIPAVIDPKTGNPIILWRHIQAAFEKAKVILNGDSLVSFMIDENLEEVIPLRIAYHPGVVLDVVMETTERIISTKEAVSLSQIHSAGKEESKGHDDDRLNQTVATLAIEDNTTNQSLVVHPERIPHDIQSSILTHNLLHNTPLHTIMYGQADIKQSIEQHFDLLLKKQEEMLHMQQRALDRLAKIQTSVQAVLTQTYELHEYPIP